MKFCLLLLGIVALLCNKRNMENWARDETKAEVLVESGRAVQASIKSRDPPMDFSMLVFPPTVDHYITKKLKSSPVTYEKEVSLFIRDVFEELAQQHTSTVFWAADLGANVGFHTLYMASLGASVIALEPAPDTFNLLRGSLDLNPTLRKFITLLQCGASDIYSTGTFARHSDSPGMTTLAATKDLPWDFYSVSEALLQPAEQIFAQYGLPVKSSKNELDLVLLKMDVEGHELRAFRGVNLDRYPFQYIIFEFFPLLIKATGDDPVDLLQYILSKGYQCSQKWSIVKDNNLSWITETRPELEQWCRNIKSHTNLYCKRKQSIN